MCIKPLSIFNPSSKVPSIGGALRLKVPCGKCFECKEKKKSEYYVRTFAEYQRLEDKVKRHEAVVYFDTLTYNNKNLPSWNGIPVFNHNHIQLFLKRFRKNLSSLGIDSNGKVKYFICSEFGEKRHRPHYHILFFLDFWLDPATLWHLVKSCWKYGKTDRLKSAVVHGVYKRGAAERYVDRNGALKYVSGYVVKDDSFLAVFDSKVRELVAAGHKLNDSELRSLQPRFFLSREFGLSFVDDLQLKYHFDYEYYVKTGKVTISDEDHIKRDFGLPQYLERKLFFTLRKERLDACGPVLDSDGNPVLYTRGKHKGEIKYHYRYFWEPNEKYIQYQYDYYPYKIDNLTTKYHDCFINIPNDSHTDDGHSLRGWLCVRMSGRSWRDLAVYSSLYRGKLCLSDYIYTSNDDFLQNFYNSKFIALNHVPGNPYLDKQEMRSQEYDLGIHQHIINEDSSPAFKDFDKILDILESHLSSSADNKARRIISIRKQKSKYKNLYNSY